MRGGGRRDRGPAVTAAARPDGCCADDARQAACSNLGTEGYDVAAVATLAEAQQNAAAGPFDLLLADFLAFDGQPVEKNRLVQDLFTSRNVVLTATYEQTLAIPETVGTVIGSLLIKPHTGFQLITAVRDILSGKP